MDEAAVRHVLAYLEARRTWELRTQIRFDHEVAAGRVGEVVREIQIEYEGLLGTFCTPKVVNRNVRAAFGSPPTVDPARTRFRGVRFSRGTAVVVTHEVTKVPGGRQFDLIDEYEYVLRGSGTDWLIDDRRSRDSDGRWIRSIL